MVYHQRYKLAGLEHDENQPSFFPPIMVIPCTTSQKAEVTMKICILDGSRPDDAMGNRIEKLLIPLLSEHQTELFVIREMEIAPCMGDFLCWTKTPGICKNHDDNRLIAEAMIKSELLILLSPITFGGYSSLLKSGLDHLIQNISPFFTKIEGQTHHKKRYKRYPNLAVIGWETKPDSKTEMIFKHLVWRNSLNFSAEKTCCEIFHPVDKDEHITKKIRGILEGTSTLLDHQVLLRKATQDESPTKERIQTKIGPRIQKALLLVGSPRKERSSSQSLGSYLCSRLQQHTVETETVLLYARNMRENQEEVFAKIDKADLVILAFPLYVDSMPSPVIEFLEQLRIHKDSEQSINRTTEKNRDTTHLIALVNCGFPEASHNDTALAILEQFAKSSGFLWMGGIGVGGGNGFGGKSLEEGTGATIPIRMALDLASEALAKGEPIPQVAVDMAMKQPYPSFLFRFGAQFFWRAKATRYGVKREIDDKPYNKD